MSNSEFKIENCKLLRKYLYIKIISYIIEKAKLTLSLKPKQKKILVNTWTVICFVVYLAD